MPKSRTDADHLSITNTVHFGRVLLVPRLNAEKYEAQFTVLVSTDCSVHRHSRTLNVWNQTVTSRSERPDDFKTRQPGNASSVCAEPQPERRTSASGRQAGEEIGRRDKRISTQRTAAAVADGRATACNSQPAPSHLGDQHVQMRLPASGESAGADPGRPRCSSDAQPAGHRR